jgi:hypothetical protein
MIQLLRTDHYRDARYVVTVFIIQVIVFGVFGGLIFYFTWENLGYLFTGNEDIVNRTRDMIIFAGCFLFANSINLCFRSILRSIGYSVEVMGLTFLSIWILGIPLGVYFTFYASPVYGLEGFWFGLILGIGLECLILFFGIISIDWEKESKKMKYRCSLHTRSEAEQTQLLLRHQTTISLTYADIISPYMGSRAVGGFEFVARTLEEELDELASIELVVK